MVFSDTGHWAILLKDIGNFFNFNFRIWDIYIFFGGIWDIEFKVLE